MRGMFLAALAVLGGSWTAGAQAQDNWIPRHDEFRPPPMHHFGHTPYDPFYYHVPHLYRHYYTPPSRNPGEPPSFGYTPRDTYRFRQTRQFNFYHYDENGMPR